MQVWVSACQHVSMTNLSLILEEGCLTYQLVITTVMILFLKFLVKAAGPRLR